MAAETPRDGEIILDELVRQGMLDVELGIEWRERLNSGDALGDVLSSLVIDHRIQEIFFVTFLDNLREFVRLGSEGTFERSETVFVENLQVSHDTLALLGQIEGSEGWAEEVIDLGGVGAVLAAGHAPARPESGEYFTQTHHLEPIDLGPVLTAVVLEEEDEDEVIEAVEALEVMVVDPEGDPLGGLEGVLLDERGIRRKLEICNMALAEAVRSVDRSRGEGEGIRVIRDAVNSLPPASQEVVGGGQIDAQGRLPVDRVLAVLESGRGSDRVVGEALLTLIDLAVSKARNVLHPSEWDQMVMSILTYQQRLGE
ncbi:MAG: hypothetical protein QGG40_05105 [Myxococcota bacterium]|nr:hypothetical protein [Myxococcota bacterium]